ncbi:hypothetical protein PRIPAC_96679 [Pristionchus pacificus]|uniref:Uncharacterized protein n=1 Tax=Pristionchus pacificus TaxID=54126 RepID=A0A2A6D2U4_PRIPA|nr:hypothetical protein PRIPAC_96679 [Pristionchus pacificus]|eukprot:PDM84613.1 hypothetical protein PRIPAC_33636 [Pristionchus pacificus]
MCQRIERCCSSNSATIVDDSAVNPELLFEWNQLTKREYALEQQLNIIEQEGLQKYPEMGIAKKVVCKIIHIDRRSLRLGRILALLRMRDRAVKLVRLYCCMHFICVNIFTFVQSD